MPNLRRFLSDNEAVIGINSPFDYLHLKILRLTLSSINSWPLKEIGEKESKFLATFFNYFFFTFWFLCWSGSVLFLINHQSELDFLEVGHLYLVALMISVDVSRVSTLTCRAKYRGVARDFLTKFHLFYYKDRSEYAMTTHKQIHFISHNFSLCLVVQMLTGLVLFNVIPIYNNYSTGKYSMDNLQNTTYEHSLYLSYPFNTSTSRNGYIFAFIFHWIVSYLSGTWFCMIDLFLYLMVFHLWGHFKILNNSLRNFPKPISLQSKMEYDGFMITNEMYSKEELKMVADKLKECIEYHREILSFTGKISDVFGPMLLASYIFHQTSGCFLLLECSQMTAPALMRYLPITCVLFQQLIQLSVIFELVGSESEKLKDAIYGVPWECMDTKNRKVVAFFLMNVQEPVHVKALGVANIGVTSMATVVILFVYSLKPRFVLMIRIDSAEVLFSFVVNYVCWYRLKSRLVIIEKQVNRLPLN